MYSSQLSLDGKRLYVTSSLFSPWDKQFYPDMCSKVGGIHIAQIEFQELSHSESDPENLMRPLSETWVYNNLRPNYLVLVGFHMRPLKLG